MVFSSLALLVAASVGAYVMYLLGFMER